MIMKMAPVNKFNTSSFSVLLILLLIGTFEVSTVKLNRKLESQFNPRCPHSICHSTNKTVNLMYTKATGSEDILHYVISTIGIPSVFVARTGHGAHLNINWTSLVSRQVKDSITFNKPVFYAYAVMIPSLLQYNDSKGTANISKADPNEIMNCPLEGFVWDDANNTSDFTKNYINFTSSQHQNENCSLLFTRNNTFFSFKLEVLGSASRNSMLPHLDDTANTTQLDVTLNNLTSLYANGRFALELVMVTSKVVNQSHMEIDVDKSIDDEQTPGVFELLDWTSEGKDQTKGGYIQWRPVCYTSTPRDMQSATKVFYYPLKQENFTNPGDSLVYAYFGEHLGEDTVAMATNVSFGLKKDKFYRKTNYTSWSASIGYGSPPRIKVSLGIILVIAIGLGLPAILIFIGGIAICIKKRTNRHKGYTSINT